MKSISITGKRNTDKISSLENPDIVHERNSIKKWSKDILLFYENHEEQVSIINKLYMDVTPLENREIFIPSKNGHKTSQSFLCGFGEKGTSCAGYQDPPI